ncbi:hypothetical protein EMIHUDRAFT_210731 [Emiliania huxleyi CCMP1516]|uniref:DEAD/DEAH box helicase n=4 Tax=Emiliania huxleyi TaxID=2903 RepID=A0A0D3IYM1_EMIH1|nr:hypothetical protein EMIHUDRAFT_210731 [Emiliania huxleyi CCMP1516]EOD16356.1 hypothetical protein EMIHUDRAFT_210731 [Emiliania huxleyi CCMP1516]|eukprot:XP_005768785.1 hypothetical protein EMIHUDRAFT_210731 [Emiliania huxleyi CCMP1516]
MHAAAAVGARVLTALAAGLSRGPLARMAEEALGAPPPVFGDLPLGDATSAALRGVGITRPTPIQQAAMMRLFRGEHAVIHSATGSGKTLAYLLPLLQRLHTSRPGQLVVVVPSRELALQTAAAVEWAWPHHGTQRAFLLTNTSAPPAELAEAMRVAACPVVVATPRPLLGAVRHLAGTDRLHSRRALRASGGELAAFAARLRAVVLDEADALLLSRQLALAGPPKKMRAGRAALTGEMGRLLSLPDADQLPLLTEANAAAPAKRKVGQRGRGAVGVPPAISHSWVPVPAGGSKGAAAAAVLRALAPKAALYFVDCVILSALPEAADTYLHLAGRTGRCGRPGRVVSLLGPDEHRRVGAITRQLGVSIRGDADLALAVAEATGEAGGEAAVVAEGDGAAGVEGELFSGAEWAEISW